MNWLRRLFKRTPATKDIGPGQFGMGVASQCPSCHANLDAATKMTGPSGGPKSGDLSICWYCSVMLEFKADLTLQLISDETWTSLPIAVKVQMLKGAELAAQVNGPQSKKESRKGDIEG